MSLSSVYRPCCIGPCTDTDIVSNFLIRFFSIKNGKVVIVLSGRFAGRKAVVVKASDEGNESTKKFGHALGT